MRGRFPGGSAGVGLAGVGVAALAVVCCATFPILAGVLGGVALGSVLGVGAGVAAALGVWALVLLRARRPQACELPDQDSVGETGVKTVARPPEGVT